MSDKQVSMRTNERAFAALKNDGTVVAWGHWEYGGRDSDGPGYTAVPSGLEDVVAIYSNPTAFVALKDDGTLAAWGSATSNMNYTSPPMPPILHTSTTSGFSKITAVYSTNMAFAALMENNTVHVWGHSDYGGDMATAPTSLTDITTISSNYAAFAALRSNGSVSVWGYASYGGNKGDATGSIEVPSGLSNVQAIYSTDAAFAALKQDGTVVAWGYSSSGGSGVPAGLTNVQAIYSTGSAFAALKQDGTVAAWGYSSYGGSVPAGLSNVHAIYSTGFAFAALKQDGTVEAWGHSIYGGSGVPAGLSNVQAIYSTKYAFAALKQDGTVVAWGSSDYGGYGVPSGLSNVQAIYSTERAFAALKQDGTVAAWGEGGSGGIGVPAGLSNVKAIYSTYYAFSALKTDGTVEAWGSYVGNNGGSDVPSGLSGVKNISYGNYYFRGKYYHSRILDPVPPSPPVMNTISSPTSDNTPTITGTGINGHTIKLFQSSSQIGQGTVASGVWSVTTVTLSDDSYTITATTTNSLGIESAASAAQTLIINTTPPSAPTVSFPSGTTNNATITITLATGATTWEYSINSGTNWTTGSGTSFTLSDGDYGIGFVQVRNSDAALNTSNSTSNTSSITIDTTPPSAPTVSFPSGTTKNATINITLATGATTWEYSINSGTNWTTGSGTSFTLSDGDYGIGFVQVRNSDAALNTSNSTSNTSSITIDTTPPSAPTVSFPSGTTNNATINITLATGATTWEYSINSGTNWTTGSGTSFTLSDGDYGIGFVQVRNSDAALNTSNSTNNTSSITIDTIDPSAPGVSFPSGTTKNATINITLATGATTWEYSINSGTNWTTGSGTSFTLSDGDYGIGFVQVRNSDAALNTSNSTSNTSSITIDTIDPSAPTVSFPSGTTKNATINITLATGATTWEYSINSGTNWTTGSGTSFTLSDGDYGIGFVQVRNKDAALNTSNSTSNTSSITIDTIDPSAPTVSFPSGTTKNATINITLATGATTWEYSINSGTNWTTGSGTSFTLSDGDYGIGFVQVRNKDAALNTSNSTSNTSSITIDTIDPSAPTVSFPSGTTNNATINITLATGATTWEYSINSGTNWTTGSGTSFTLSDGDYGIGFVQVRNKDAALNTSNSTSNTSSITIDTTAPSAPGINAFASPTADTTPTITGTGVTGDTITLFVDGSSILPTDTVASNGTWTITPTSALGDGSYTITAKATDPVGNVSVASASSTLVISTGAPSPTVSFPSGTTNNALVIVTLATGATTWEYNINGSGWVTGSATLFTLQPGAYSPNAVQVRNSNAQGVASATTSNTSAFTVLQMDKQVSIHTNLHAFAALKNDGTVVAWGSSSRGGSGVPSGLSNVQAIYSTSEAFAALKQDGTVEAWGSSSLGGSGVPAGLSNVQSIYSTDYAFAALKQDGSVAAWGHSGNGGSGVPAGLSNVQAIYSTDAAFAALKTDGTVEAWGSSNHGGRWRPAGLSNVQAIYSTDYAFAALKTDGTVAAWGYSTSGGSGMPSGLSNVTAIYSTSRAFAALKQDGTVAAWGDSAYGGSGVPAGLSNVQAIYSTYYAFAALKQDGSVAAWGNPSFGGSGVPSGLSNVQAIYSTDAAFAALKQDGSVAAWGYSSYGGSGVPSGLSNVQAIYSTLGAFAALKQDGSVAAWGHSSYGGSGVPSGLSNVTAIYSTSRAFAALKQDGTVAAWGHSDYGGDESSVQSQLTGVKIISYGNHYYQGKYYTSTVIDPSLPSPPVINTISTPTNDATPTVTGTGITGHTITLFAGSNSIGTATVANGVWSITSSTLTNATYAITATATNPIGVVSFASTSQPIEIAATVPSISAITTSNFSWGSVLNGTEDDTNGTVTVNTINVENGNNVTITLNSVNYTGTVTANVSQVSILASGLQGLTDGQSYTMDANVSNTAGTAATTVTSSSFTVDITAPSAPGINAFASPTSDTTPTITGTGVTGDTITLFVDGSSILPTDTVASNGTWTITPTSALGNGSYTITAKATDPAGNISSASAAPTLVIAPSAPTVSFPSGTTNNELVIVTLATGATTWEYNINGAGWVTGSATLFTLQPGAYSQNAVQVRNSDAAGNASTTTNNTSSFIVLQMDTQVSMITNRNAIAALKQDGTVVAWGFSDNGGSVPVGLSGVKAIYSSSRAFAALKQDGSVAAWGSSSSGGSGVPSGLSNVQAIYSTLYAFAALKQDGSVAAWGDSSYGGSGVPSGLSGVKAIYSTQRAFAALKEDGTVEAWGYSSYGGTVPSSLSGVKAIYSTAFDFAALKVDGTVTSWGYYNTGNNGGSGVPVGLSGVKAIYSTSGAFAALKDDGTVAEWGSSSGLYGMPSGLTDSTASGFSPVTAIYSSQYSFVVLKQDGSVVAWGSYVGNNGGSDVPSDLTDSTAVQTIYASLRSYAALKQDGTVVVWGQPEFGGSMSDGSGYTGVPSGLTDSNAAGFSAVKIIYSTSRAFAALKQDGTVAAWGDASYGGSVPAGLSNVHAIYSTGYAFAALKKDGTVVVWGQFISIVSDPPQFIDATPTNTVQSQLTNVRNISYGNNFYQGRGYKTNTVIDPSLPSPPIINTISTPQNINTPTVTGSGITGHTITLFAGSTSIGTATVANGVWSITSSTLTNATYAITATATNPIGVVSSASTSQSIEIAASAVPSISPITTSNFSWGSVLNGTEDDTDGTVNVNTINVENGNPVTITINGTSISNTATVTTNVAQVPILASELQSLTDGQSYTITANVSNSAGTAATTVTSSSFTVNNVNDSPTGTVTISGTVQEGQTLTASNSIADADGLGTITYQWTWVDALGDIFNISGATNPTYTLTQSEVGFGIMVIANYTDLQGTSESVQSSTTTLVIAATQIQCLVPSSAMNVVNSNGNKYLLNGETLYNQYRKYGLNTGIYTITGVPSSHPVALINATTTSNIVYAGDQNKKSTLSVSGTLYDFYHGDVVITVYGDFGAVSLYCFHHGYMGGQNLLTFSSACTSPPAPSPSPPVINTISTPTNDATPTVTGTGVTGHTIILYEGSNGIGTATVANGVWSITSSILSVGQYTITATATNPIGVVSSPSASQTIEITSGTPPSAPPPPAPSPSPAPSPAPAPEPEPDITVISLPAPEPVLPEPQANPSDDFDVSLENRIVTVDTYDYTYTIEKLGDLEVTWSYSINGGKNWSNEYTLHEKNKFTLPFGRYQFGSIIIRTKTADNDWTSPNLFMNETYDIIKRPGIPSVRFQHKNGIVVYNIGIGSVKWRYSLNSGETWSEYLYKPLVVYPPVGNYVAGSIYIKGYAEDGTSHRNYVLNYDFYTAGIPFAGTFGLVTEQITSNIVSFEKTSVEQQYDDEVSMINSITNWPSSATAKISVDITSSDYTSWEYSTGLNEKDIRVWIKGDTTPADIPPGYYDVYTIAIRLKKYIPETGEEYSITVFNLNELVIYPKQPKVTYIEKGIFVISLLDKNSTWEYKVKSDDWVNGSGSTVLLKPDTYKIGEIMIRSVVNDNVTSHFTSNLVTVVVRDNDYHVNEMPDKNWETTTILTTPAYKNDMILNVYSNYRFAVKKAIIIGYGAESETRIVTGLGSLFIDRPLTKNYPEGTLIRGFDIELIDSLSLAERAYGMIITSNLKLGTRKRLKCMKYLYDPENATIETCNVTNETKHLLGEGQLTKKKKIKDMVRFNKGKIVYGDNGLSSPFLPPDTLEDTPVSNFYRCSVPNDVPIINGLRGGVVPVAMRTNKF